MEWCPFFNLNCEVEWRSLTDERWYHMCCSCFNWCYCTIVVLLLLFLSLIIPSIFLTVSFLNGDTITKEVQYTWLWFAWSLSLIDEHCLCLLCSCRFRFLTFRGKINIYFSFTVDGNNFDWDIVNKNIWLFSDI